MKKRIIIIGLLLLIGVGAYFAYNTFMNATEPYFLASDTATLMALDNNQEPTSLIRGQAVKAQKQVISINGEEYRKIYLGEDEYYVKQANIVLTTDDVVLEKTLDVKTSCSVLNIDDRSAIGLLNKGDTVEITGHSELLANGEVEFYHINYQDDNALVYAKYLLKDSHDEALEQIHHQRGDIYGGGDAGSLDYSINEKANFANNPMPAICNSIYLNVSSLANVDDYIDFAINNNINTFVIDIKDSHIPSYASTIMEVYSPTTYANARMSFDDFQAAVKKVKDAGIYLVGRITVFKDTNYATDHPEVAIVDKTENASLFFNSSYWPSAYKRDVWSYNVALAKEAVSEMGFNEIQFDYVRFPDHIDIMEMNDEIDLLNEYGETKAQAIQRFIMYAADELHELEAYISVDVFGETSNSYVTAYGQYWPAISNYVDVISAMPYPDHFGIHDYGISEAVWEVPYELLTLWGKDAQRRQSETPSPAKVRTWIQGYDSYREPYVEYDSSKISEQISALYENGLNGGFIVWNAASNLERYQSYADAFNALN